MGRYRWIPDHPAEKAGELKFFEFPAEELRARGVAGRKKSVCVIGAGMAGLVTAYELAKEGNSVSLLEAEDRSGGRVYTWHKEGVSGEFGAMRIAPAHGGTMHYVKEFGLRQGRFVQHNADGWLLLRDQRVRIAEWLTLLDAYGGDPRNMFGQPLDKTDTDPDALLQEAFSLAKTGLSPGERWSVMNGTLGPAARALGAITLWQLVEGILRDITSWAGPWAPTAPEATPRTPSQPPLRLFSRAGWEFIGRATSALWEERISALEACIEDIWVRGTPRVRVVDGMDALPKALEAKARELGATIHFGTPVTDLVSEPLEDRVRVYSSDVEMFGADGNPFQYVICAVPARATAAINFDPPLSTSKYEALTNLTYLSAAKSLIFVRRRYWELDNENKIFGGASYTDLPIQQCWYPCDNAKPDPDEPLRETRVEDVGDAESVATAYDRFIAEDEERSHTPAILTAAYRTGINAERFTSLTPQQRDDEVERCLEKLHPGINADIEDIAHCCWIEQRTPGGGAWTYFGPGTHERYQDALCEPHPSPEAPRVFFAGEHLCVLHGWMQSAIQSALEATMSVMERP